MSGPDPRIAEATAEPSAAAVGVCRDMAFEAIVETAELAESYARSLGEAAWRGDRVTVEVHLRQLKACFSAAVDAFKMLNTGGGS